MGLFKYYKISLIPSSLFVVAIQTIFVLIAYTTNYKNDLITSTIDIIWFVTMITMNALIISIFSLPIFYNYKDSIRKQFSYSLFFWFCSPAMYIGYVMFVMLSHSRLSYTGIILFNTIPYLIGLVWGFIEFRKEVNREKS